MDQVINHKESIQKLLHSYLQGCPADQNVETQVIADEKNGHFQIVNVGWEDEHRIYGCVLHLDVKGDKIWIQQNMTELPVAEELVALGVPKEQIVVGFHAPNKRRLTEFALN